MTLPDEALEDGRLMTQAFEGAGEAIGQPAEAGEAAVGKFTVFEIAPDPLGRIKVRCIAGQPFQMEALGSTVGRNVRTASPQ